MIMTYNYNYKYNCNYKLETIKSQFNHMKNNKTFYLIQLLVRKAPFIKQSVRNLDVHEHVAYSLLKKAGIPTPPFGVATSPNEVAILAKELNTKDLVLKAQVLAGGRGKGHFKDTDVSGVMMCET